MGGEKERDDEMDGRGGVIFAAYVMRLHFTGRHRLAHKVLFPEMKLMGRVQLRFWWFEFCFLAPCKRAYREKHHFRPSDDDTTVVGEPHPE